MVPHKTHILAVLEMSLYSFISLLLLDSFILAGWLTFTNKCGLLVFIWSALSSTVTHGLLKVLKP